MKNVHLCFGALVLAICAGGALAQRPGGNGPLPGDPTYGGGGRQYAPPPAPPRPTGEWIKTWGAIAQDPYGQGGVAVGKLSKNDAENEATQLCIKGGGKGCKPLFAYMNQCVVVARPIRVDGAGTTIQSAESIEIATRLSIEVCKEKNGGACEIFYSACSDPIFRSY